jgi:hypothetical protein
MCVFQENGFLESTKQLIGRLHDKLELTPPSRQRMQLSSITNSFSSYISQFSVSQKEMIAERREMRARGLEA